MYTLSDTARPHLPFTGERILPYLHDGEYEQIQYALKVHHQAMYQFIARYCDGKRVLDVGSGTGHGMSWLRNHTHSAVWGMDIAHDTLSFAMHYYPHLAGRVVNCDALHLAFAPAQFDVVCAVEVFEHVSSAEAFLSEVTRVMRPDGVYIMSTPNRVVVSPGSPRPLNPFHTTEYTYQELHTVLSRFFRHVEMNAVLINSRSLMACFFRQALNVRLPFPLANIERYLYWHVPPWNRQRVRLHDIVIKPGDVPRCWGFLVVCSEPFT